MRDKFLKALKGENVGRPPLWLMRQAGRYLPEYQALRKKHDFLTLCHTPELICEVAMQPIRRFDFDAAILFSDILMIPDAMGLGLRFDDNKGPVFSRPLQTAADIEALTMQESLSFVKEGIKLLKKELDRPLIGFAGAPFTVASYMIEGGSSHTLRKTKKWLLQDPTSFHLLLEKIKCATIEYLKMQIEAGVDAVQLFESWASHLAHRQLQEFSVTYLNAIKEALPAHIPVIMFARGTRPSNVFNGAALSVDFMTSLKSVRQEMGPSITLQGNLDPEILFASKETVIHETRLQLAGLNNDPAWIFNLGHGILPETPLENVYAMRDTVFNHVA